jgi:hypothetical protein
LTIGRVNTDRDGRIAQRLQFRKYPLIFFFVSPKQEQDKGSNRQRRKMGGVTIVAWPPCEWRADANLLERFGGLIQFSGESAMTIIMGRQPTPSWRSTILGSFCPAVPIGG